MGLFANLRRKFRLRRAAIETVEPTVAYDEEPIRPMGAPAGQPDFDPIMEALSPMREIEVTETLEVVTDDGALSTRKRELTGRRRDGPYVTRDDLIIPVDRLRQRHGYGSARCAVDGMLYSSRSLVECGVHGRPICVECAVKTKGVSMCLRGYKELKRMQLWDTILFRNRGR